MCYFYHNTSACDKCPKTNCNGREPREVVQPISDEPVDTAERLRFLVRIGEYLTLSIPNPKTHYALFCDVIREIASGKYKTKE